MVHKDDDAAVALADLKSRESYSAGGEDILLLDDIPSAIRPPFAISRPGRM
jgi:hypothetical protein